jgi:hypothetical protein
VDDATLITEILNEHWTDECEFVGEATTEKSVQAAIEGKTLEEAFGSAKGGANMDLGKAIEILIAAATFLKQAIEIYRMLTDELKAKPPAAQVDERAVERAGVGANLPPAEQRAKAIQAIEKKL